MSIYYKYCILLYCMLLSVKGCKENPFRSTVAHKKVLVSSYLALSQTFSLAYAAILQIWRHRISWICSIMPQLLFMLILSNNKTTARLTWYTNIPKKSACQKMVINTCANRNPYKITSLTETIVLMLRHITYKFKWIACHGTCHLLKYGCNEYYTARSRALALSYRQIDGQTDTDAWTPNCCFTTFCNGCRL